MWVYRFIRSAIPRRGGGVKVHSEWENWKFGAKVVACVGIGAFMAWASAVLLVGALIVLPVELILGLDAVEDYMDLMVAIITLAVTPSFAAFMLEQNGLRRNSK